MAGSEVIGTGCRSILQVIQGSSDIYGKRSQLLESEMMQVNLIGEKQRRMIAPLFVVLKA
jgi:hypothetical protein